jgi:hypothetical protein
MSIPAVPEHMAFSHSKGRDSVVSRPIRGSNITLEE